MINGILSLIVYLLAFLLVAYLYRKYRLQSFLIDLLIIQKRFVQLKNKKDGRSILESSGFAQEFIYFLDSCNRNIRNINFINVTISLLYYLRHNSKSSKRSNLDLAFEKFRAKCTDEYFKDEIENLYFLLHFKIMKYIVLNSLILMSYSSVRFIFIAAKLILFGKAKEEVSDSSLSPSYNKKPLRAPLKSSSKVLHEELTIPKKEFVCELSHDNKLRVIEKSASNILCPA